MAKKRTINRSEMETKADAGEPREEDRELAWGEWARKHLSRYWYILGCAFLDLLVGLELLRIQSDPLKYAILSLFLIVAVYLEFLLYRRLWPQKR